MNRFVSFIAGVAFLATLSPAGAATLSHPTILSAGRAPALDAANGLGSQYCAQTGGLVENRIPEYGTNNPNPLVLSGSALFCQYTSKKDGSRIHVMINTLMAGLPTLAAMAYYAKVPYVSSSCPGGANPASCYCTQLGASDQFGGATLGGGSWVSKSGIDIDLEACIFPDLSSIDSWGLLYHSVGTIRGIDLAKVLLYRKR